MNYYESAENITITKVRAVKEVEDHSCDLADFLKECGNKETYLATDVLDWLGY